MTTPIVQSITDEQLADIDVQRFECTNGRAQFCYGCYRMSEDAHGDYVSAEDYARLMVRLRAVELDAKRYRWLRDSGRLVGEYLDGSESNIICGVAGDEGILWFEQLDRAIDTAMKPKP